VGKMEEKGERTRKSKGESYQLRNGVAIRGKRVGKLSTTKEAPEGKEGRRKRGKEIRNCGLQRGRGGSRVDMKKRARRGGR